MVAAFFGDGAMEEGVFWESLNAACLYKLPIVFVCEDNGLAVDVTANERQGFRSIKKAISGFNCDYLVSDSTDAEEIYNLAAKARAIAATKSRPVFLHLQYYRLLRAHRGEERLRHRHRPVPGRLREDRLPVAQGGYRWGCATTRSR